MKVPKEVLPRFIAIGENTFVPLEAVIARNLHELFPGMEITAHDYFRVTRDADFTVSDEADDLVRAVEQELRQRRFGEVVRLEVGDTMEPELRRQLVEWLGVEERQVYDMQGMLDLSDLWDIHGIEGYSDLRDPPYTPVIPPAFRAGGGRREAGPVRGDAPADVLVHYPYESFAASVERFVEQAVKDPDVLAIKMTVYRTSDDSRARPVTDRGLRGGQAGGLPGGAEGALRRAPQHHLGARTGGGGRACRARAAGRQDARQGPARRAGARAAASGTT